MNRPASESKTKAESKVESQTDPGDLIRRVTIAFEPRVLEFVGLAGVAEYVERVEKYEELRSLNGDTFYVARIIVNHRIRNVDQLIGQFGLKELHVIYANHPEYFVFYHMEPNQPFAEILEEVEFDCYFTYPEYYDGKNYVMSFYTHQSKVGRIFQLFHDRGIDFKVHSLVPPMFIRDYFLQQFSPKQLEILMLAGAYGYYDFPRKTSGKELANMLGITTQTFHEHLRKAENKIAKLILADVVPRR